MAQIVDRKDFEDDLLYRNPTTAQLEYVERPEYAGVTGLVLELPGNLFAYPDPEFPQALIINPTDLAYDDPERPGSSLVIGPGAPVSETSDPTELEVREA